MVLIENLLGKPIWVRRNNGGSLNISPGMQLVEVSEAEWKTNPMLKKLAAQGALRARPPREKPRGGEGARTARNKEHSARRQAGGSPRSTPEAETAEQKKP